MTTIRYITSTEREVGKGHATLSDTLNRGLRDVLTASGLDPDVDFGGFLPTSGAGLFNVKAAAYGAKGDGTTDDTVAIQAAATAAGVSGGMVYFPPGTYSLTGIALTSKSYVTFYGAGKASKLVMAGSTNGAMLTLTMCNWMTVKDLWFYGNNIGTVDGASGTAVYFDATGTAANLEGFVVSGCTFENFRGAIWVRVQNPTNFDVSKVWWKNNVALGGSDQDPATIGTASAQFGLRLATGSGNINDVLVEGNYCEASTVKNGIYAVLSSGTGKFRRVMYHNNTVMNAGLTNVATVKGAYGLILYGTNEDCAITANQSLAAVTCGIYCNLSRRVRLVGNTCTDTTETDDSTLPRGGIALNDSYGFIVNGNTLNNNALAGVQFSMGSATEPIGAVVGNNMAGGQFGVIVRLMAGVSPTGIVIANNDIKGTSDYAIMTRRTTGTGEVIAEMDIVGNVITGCANGIGSTAIAQTLRNVRIAENIVKVTGPYGIQMDATGSTADGVTLEHNTVDGGTSIGIAMSGGTWTQARCIDNLVRNAGTNADTAKGCFRLTSVFVGETRGNIGYPVAGGSVCVAGTQFPHESSRVVTTTYSAVIGDDVLRADATGGTFTITFPLAASCPGKRLTVMKTDVPANGVVTIGRAGADTINNGTTYTIANRYQAVTLESNGGTAWFVVGDGVVSITGDLQVPNNLTFPVVAVSRIVAGATSLSLRNNANNADNLIFTDAGAGTIRGSLTQLTETANDNSTKSASTAYVDRATTHTGTTSAAPTGTASATAVMMGLAGSITPTRGTKIIVMVSGQMANNTLNDGVTVDLRFGTGAAPVNGAAVSGTLVGIAQSSTSLVAASKDGFCVMGKVTGLSVGTVYWLDLSLLAITAGTATVTGVSVTAFEVP